MSQKLKFFIFQPEIIVNPVLGVRTCRLAAQASESDFEPLRTARAYDLDKRRRFVIRKKIVDPTGKFLKLYEYVPG